MQNDFVRRPRPTPAGRREDFPRIQRLLALARDSGPLLALQDAVQTFPADPRAEVVERAEVALVPGVTAQATETSGSRYPSPGCTARARRCARRPARRSPEHAHDPSERGRFGPNGVREAGACPRRSASGWDDRLRPLRRLGRLGTARIRLGEVRSAGLRLVRRARLGDPWPARVGNGGGLWVGYGRGLAGGGRPLGKGRTRDLETPIGVLSWLRIHRGEAARSHRSRNGSRVRDLSLGCPERSG
jgi:hypothetical protein